MKYLSLLVLILQFTVVPTNIYGQESEKADEKINEDSQVKYLRIRSVGDILLHDSVYNQAAQGDGSYDFSWMFTEVKPYLENADITTANLETLAAGTSIGLSTYPTFNGPAEIIDTLKDMGVDIVNNATNHTMDRGVDGALLSIQNLKDRDMLYMGSYESWDDYNTPRVIDIDGIKVGFVSYTYGLNGNYLPEDQTYLATLIDNDLIPLEIKRLKKYADIVIVNYHCGEEYDYYPSAWQDEIFKIAKEAGANFVLGGHPHVLQPGIIWNDQQAGIFSHGNFLSGQVDLDQKIGAIWEYTFKIDQDKNITIDSLQLMPTYNMGYPEFQYYSVIPLADAGNLGLFNVDQVFEDLKARMTTYSPQVKVVKYLD